MTDIIKFNNNEFYLCDYDGHSDDNTKLGIWFYDQQVYFGDKINNDIKSYKFKIELYLKKIKQTNENSTDEEWKSYFDEVFRSGYRNYKECIEFIYTCKLSDYKLSTEIKEKFKYLYDKNETHHESFDWEKLINDAAPDKLKFVTERILRAENLFIPDKVIYEGKYNYEKQEFLEFDDSAYVWGGPFEHKNGKLGALIDIKPNNWCVGEYPIFDPSVEFNSYHIPTHLHEGIYNSLRLDPDFETKYAQYAPKKNGDRLDVVIGNWLHNKNKEEKREFFNSLPVNEKHIVAKKYYASRQDPELIESRLPYKIYMYGTDDCSYSKYFGTLDELEKEVLHLRKMQPLNMEKDIYNRGYIFTN